MPSPTMNNRNPHETSSQDQGEIKSVELHVLRGGKDQIIPRETYAALEQGEQIALEIEVGTATHLEIQLKPPVGLAAPFTTLYSAELPAGRSKVRVPEHGWLQIPQGIFNSELRVRPPVKGGGDRSDDLLRASDRAEKPPVKGGNDRSDDMHVMRPQAPGRRLATPSRTPA